MAESPSSRRHPFLRKTLRRALAGLAGLLIAAALVFGLTAWRIASFGRQTSSDIADAAVVLGAAVSGDEPSPVFRERINHALELYRAGQVRKLILTGGSRTGKTTPEAEVAQHYAARHGVAEADMLLEISSTSTAENMSFARQIADKNSLHRVLIVSDPLHMKRAMHLAGHAGLEAQPSPTQTSMYRLRWSKTKFLARETYYYLKHRWSDLTGD